MRAQSSVISTILLSGIILSIVTATYVWGQPLVQKTTDKVKIDTIVNDLTQIKDKIDYTQQTGSPSTITLNIQDGAYQISGTDNAVFVRTSTLVPIIASFTYVPISATELAYETELNDVNTDLTNSTIVYTPTGYVSGTIIQFGNATLNNQLYNITVYRTSDVYDYVCIYKGDTPASTDCAQELSSVTKDVEYIISWVSNDGLEVIISGGIKENIGVLGTDPAGIVAGKSQPVGSSQQVTLELAYRGLRDATGKNYKTYITCETGCRAGTGLQNMIIERTGIDRTINSTNYYINVRFQ